VLGNLGKYLVRLKFSPRTQELLYRYLAWRELREALDQLQINCVLDVGANRGQFAVGLRKIGFRGWIISFEPSPDDFAVMKAALQADPFWRGHQIALGAEDTTCDFNITLGDTRMSSMLHLRREGAQVKVVPVQVKRLDQVLDSVLEGIEQPRVFLKMDTQGFDLKVIQGASGCVERMLGLLSEISAEPSYDNMPGYMESLKTYEDLGFRLKGVSEIAWNRRRGTLVEMDCLMIRPLAST